MKYLCLVVSASMSFTAIGQESETFINALGQTVNYSQACSYTKTPPASEWPALEAAGLPEDVEIPNNKVPQEYVNDTALPDGMDPALQTSPPFRAPAQTLVNFLGLNSAGVPPDPSGAAGPDHYMQAVNLSYRVYDKSGSILTNAFALSTLWPNSTSQGDPIVMYDRHADRWFMSQFQFSPNQILIAISETPDPTGSWHAYTFNMGQFPDYPKYSIWWDGYYMTSNSNQTAVAFERDKMLAGDPTAGMVSLSAPALGNNFFRSPLPADADGPLPPNGTPMYIFNLEDDAWGGVNQDRIKIYEFTVDWNQVSNSQVSTHQTLATDPFDTNLGSGFDNISQPNSTQKLDAIPGVFMYRAQHMRWNGYNTIMLCHVVDVNGQDHAGMRWYELRDADDGNWSIFQQGTYSPDDGDRFMGSIAMDNGGNIAMAYSYVNANAGEGAGLRYTGRWAQDTPGTMSLFESEAIAGNGAQNGTNRFGDYGHMALDPDGSTFWYTGEYLTPARRTRVFSFNIQSALSVNDVPTEPEIEMNISQTGSMIILNASGTKGKSILSAELIDLHGRTLEQLLPQRNGDRITASFEMNSRAEGAYFIRLLSDGVQDVERIVYSK